MGRAVETCRCLLDGADAFGGASSGLGFALAAFPALLPALYCRSVRESQGMRIGQLEQ